MFDRNLTGKAADYDEEDVKIFFGLVKGKDDYDIIGAIDETANGETLACYMEYEDGTVEELASIKIDVKSDDKVDLKKVRIYPIAEGEKKSPGELKSFGPKEVFLQAFYGKDAVGEPFSAELLGACFPKEAPAPAPTPAPVPPAPPAPPTPSNPTPASPVAPQVDDDYCLFYKPASEEEELCEGKYEYWLECLERGFVSAKDFEYRLPRKVLGQIIASEVKSDVKFRVEHLRKLDV